MSYKKLYCYVDETGQDTRGSIFIVALVVTSTERELLDIQLELAEKSSGKMLRKWKRSTIKQRVAYIEAIVRNPLFEGTWYFRRHTHTTQYERHLVDTITAGIRHRLGEQTNYKVVILVDGLGKVERYRVTLELRRVGIQVDKVRGPRDESDPLIRLADAIAGLVRDADEYQEYAVSLLREAGRRGILLAP